jgi:hypothetical protein
MKDIQKLLSNIRNKINKIKYADIPIKNISLPKDLFDSSDIISKLQSTFYFYPILVFKKKDKFTIIDGCKRFLYLKKNHSIKNIYCAIALNVNENELGLIRIILNNKRQLSIKEKFLFYKCLKNYGIEDVQFFNKYLQLSWEEINSLDNLLNCPSDILNAVFRNKIHLLNIEDFKTIPKIERKRIFKIFSSLKLSLQTEKEFIQWLSEISNDINLKNYNFSSILKEVSSIIKNSKINAPQKIEKIREMLFSLRFPLYHQALKEWNDTVKKINPAPAKVRFIPSLYFEKNKLELRLNFSSSNEIKEILEKLLALPLELLDKIIYPHKISKNGNN